MASGSEPHDIYSKDAPQFAAQLEPAKKGGSGQWSDLRAGGIADTRVPSKVSIPATRGHVRILAVLGTHDVINAASPANDGWFVSDFYYLHHLFRTVAKPEHQRWMTCLRPPYLVKKYKEFVHGDPLTDDRRVVLDSLLLDSVKTYGLSLQMTCAIGSW